MKKRKIAIIINHLSFFCSHILPVALAAKKNGYVVKIFCGYGGSKEMEVEAKKIIKKNNLSYENIGFTPSSKNIFFEIFFFFKILKFLKNFNPDIIHGITFKGIIYSSLYRFFFYNKKLICYVTGLGYFFTRKLNTYEKFLKYFVILFVKLALKLNDTLLVVENKYDYQYFLNKVKINKNKIVRINGAGANLKKFYFNKKNKKKIILFPARVLLEKGIVEFIDASKELTRRYPQWKFLIAGTLNYKKGEEEKIFTNVKLIQKRYKNIIFLGYVKDIKKLFNKASIVCLPSYREGFPKALIEACASGCAIVATNVPGCRDAIINNYNGLLCKVKNYSDTRIKLEKLILDEKKRKIFSKNSRILAEKKYSLNIYIKKNLNFYAAKHKK